MGLEVTVQVNTYLALVSAIQENHYHHMEYGGDDYVDSELYDTNIAALRAAGVEV